jgi:hypothetical protein
VNPHAMEEAKRASARISGVPNVTYDLIAVLYNLLEGIAAIEAYKQDAEEAGDDAAAAFFAEWQRTARGQTDRLQGLLAERLAGAAQGAR